MRRTSSEPKARPWARPLVGWALLLTGVTLTVVLAFMGNKHNPPSASTQALLALLAILAQGGSGWAFAGLGRADPTLARSAVSRLSGLARHSVEARQLAEALAEQKDLDGDLRSAAGKLSVHLSYLEEGFIESVEDWRSFHPTTVQQVEQRASIDDE